MEPSNHLEAPYKESCKHYLEYFKEKFNDSGNAYLPLIRQIPLAICVTDSKGFFEQVNDSYCKLYQYSKDELLGKHFSIVVPSENRAKVTELHEQFMLKQHELVDEWVVKRQDGSAFHILANAAYIVVQGDAKKITFLVSIENPKQTERMLKETVKKMNHLLLSQESAMELLLHDLRGPVSNILSLAEFLDDSSFPTVQRNEFIKRLQQSAQRAYSLTNRLYGIVQIENGKYMPSPATLNFSLLISDIWSDLAILAKAKKISLKMEGLLAEKTKVKLHTDPFLINTIFYNLMKNAVEAAPERSEVRLNLISEDEKIKASVHNEGAIPEEVQLSFFQKYNTSKARGTGLGTYMVKKAAGLLNAQVSFTSSAKEGTKLYLLLPADVMKV